MIIKEPITSESMIKYYRSVLKHTKSERHKKYINEMIGYHSGTNPYPEHSVCETLKEEQ